ATRTAPIRSSMVMARPPCAPAARPMTMSASVVRTAPAGRTNLIGLPPQKRPAVDPARPGNRRENRQQREDEEHGDPAMLERVGRGPAGTGETDVGER